MIDFFAPHGITVSRETLAKFAIYKSLLLKWQRAINLVSPTTLDEIEMRHFIDSAQVFNIFPDKNARLADMGSGAGFPGLVLAIMGMRDVHLIESDVRKATFLREVSRETKTPVTIHDMRVEDCKIDNIQIVTARALAPLKDLLSMTLKLVPHPSVITCCFLKGAQGEEEIEKAKKQFDFELSAIQSISDPAGKIFNINNLIRK